MATKIAFFKKFNAMVFTIVACVLTLVSCGQNDVGDEALRSTKEYGIDYNETSKLTPDDEYGTAVLHVELDKKIGSTVETRNADVQAKCIANVETDPVETSNMEKTFVSGDIIKNNIENSIAHTFTCDIAVNGSENLIKTKVTVTPDMAWDRSYDLNVTKIKVAADEVRIVETSKKSGEKGRQAISAPVDFTISTVGTEKDNAEDHTCVVRQIVVWEQYQLESTPEIDHEEFDHAYWKLNPDFSIDYMIVLKQIWTGDKEDTFVEYPYASNVVFNTISLEDLTVKSWAYGLKNIEGLVPGTPYAKETGKEFFSEKRREDLYAAVHSNGQDKDIKCVYSCDHPEVTFTKGDISYTFNFISPSFTENGDNLLDATSMKSGYDLRIFRNSVTGKYGNQTTSVQEKVLEERCNLYKQVKAVSDVEFSNMKKSYSFGAIQYDVDCIDVYNDGTKSEKYHVTTSRAWGIDYLGAWSMNTDKDVNEVIDAIKVEKTSKTYENDVQNISNGKWTLSLCDYNVYNHTTVAGVKKDNAWKSEKFPAHMILTIHGKDCDFGEDVPTGTATGDKIEKTSSTATEETYTFSETLNFKVGDYTHKTDATGVVKKAVEVTVKSWSWENAWQKVEGNLTKAHVEKVYIMTDGSKKTVSRDFTFTRGSQVYTYWETSEANNTETTGAAGWSVLSTEAKTEGDWHFNVIKSQLTFGVACANSTQTDGWNITEANNLSVDIEGDTYTFPAMDYNASANASQSKTAETENQTTYTHTNTPNYTFGGYSMSLSSATGKIFVAKTVVPESHDGYFPKEYGRLEGDNKVACLNPSNFKDWGIGGSLKFTNGSLPYFITKDGVISFGTFEAGSTVWNGASPDGNGKLMNCDGKDASTAMKWRRDNTTINMLSYTDGKIMGFHNGNNTVVTSMFPGSIEQKDGGKWQNLTMAGVRDASGRTSFDTSF
jgi:hypothetical protein